MKEKPILFNGEMVRAVLGGRKVQTRRTMSPQPKGEVETDKTYLREDTEGNLIYCHPVPDTDVLDCKSPYGKVGDHLWVREIWTDYLNKEPLSYTLYRADFPLCWDAEDTEHGGDVEIQAEEIKWSPSIHMPRKASRINLEITGIRVERLQEITEEGAKAEGEFTGVIYGSHSFKDLWDSLYAKRGLSWESSPWVWVVEFKRI